MRLIPFALALAIGVAAAAPVHAQTQMDRANPIATCLASAAPEARRHCIGIVAGPCIEAPAASPRQDQ